MTDSIPVSHNYVTLWVPITGSVLQKRTRTFLKYLQQKQKSVVAFYYCVVYTCIFNTSDIE